MKKECTGEKIGGRLSENQNKQTATNCKVKISVKKVINIKFLYIEN